MPKPPAKPRAKAAHVGEAVRFSPASPAEVTRADGVTVTVHGGVYILDTPGRHVVAGTVYNVK